MTTASMLQSQPIRTGSTAKRRWLRFVCLTDTQSLTKRGKLNSGAWFLIEVKDEGSHPNPIDLWGGVPHPLIICMPMISSSAVIQSYYFHLGPIHLTLLIPLLGYIAFYCKNHRQSWLVLNVDSNSGARGARWARYSKVGDRGFFTWWGMMWFTDVTGAPRHWVCWNTDGLDDRWVSPCLPDAKAWLNLSSKIQQAHCAAGLARLGSDCAGLRCAGLTAAARWLRQNQAADWVMRINKISPMSLEAELLSEVNIYVLIKVNNILLFCEV